MGNSRMVSCLMSNWRTRSSKTPGGDGSNLAGLGRIVDVRHDIDPVPGLFPPEQLEYVLWDDFPSRVSYGCLARVL